MALKITIGDERYSKAIVSSEVGILQYLSTHVEHQHIGRKHVLQMLDHFTIVGPNGTHLCLAFEVMGLSISRAMENYCKNGRLPRDLALKATRQSILGLAFL